jgi:hypothetical protein
LFNKRNLISFFIIYSSLALILLLIDFSITKINIKIYFILFVFIFIIFFAIIFFINKIKEQNYKSKIIREIPLFLEKLSNDLEKNISLKIALKNRIDNSLIADKIRKALIKVEKKGYSLEESLLSVADDYKLKQVFIHISDTVNTGSKDKVFSLRTLADSISQEQNYKLKNYATKLNLTTLVFVVVSAIVPALFLMFLLVGSNFLEISFSALSIIIIVCIVFPIIDMFLLLIMKSNMP